MKKGILLARVSTERQEKEGLSLKDTQLPEMHKYAEQQGIEIIHEFVFSESADQKARKLFTSVVAFAKKHPEARAVIAYRVDRITRNYRDAVICDELRKDYDKELHFVYDRLIIDKNSSGRDIADWDTKVYLAKQQINRLRDDAIESARTQLRMGRKPGKAPMGYRNITLANNRKDIVLDTVRAPLIKEVFELYATGIHSYRTIAEIMRNKGLRTDTGRIVYRSNIEHILGDPFYSGYIRHMGELYEHNYERLISPRLFQQCQEIKQERTEKGHYKPQYKVFSLRGMVVCHYCGAIIGLDTKKNGRIRYAQCNKAKNPNCPQPRLHESVLLDQIKNELVPMLKIPDEAAIEVQDKVIADFTADQGSGKRRTSQLAKEKEESENLLYEAYRDLKSRSITQAVYDRIVAEEAERQKGWDRELANLDDPNETFIVSSEYVLSLLNRIPELYERSKDSEKLEWHKLMFSNATLEKEKLHWELKMPFDAVHSCSKTQVWLPRLDSNQRRPR